MLVPSFRRQQHLYLSLTLWRRRLVFWIGALMVGVVSVGFALAADRVQHWFTGTFANHRWWTLAVTPAGFMLSAFLCRRFFPGAQGSGIPQTIAARVLRTPEQRTNLLSMKLTAAKVFLTLLGLGCGASIGREGPTVQVGASIMLQTARWGRMGRERGLILAGGAAGVAAAFNTPLAGIVFAIEELSRAYEARTSFLVLSAVILAGLASLGMVGNYSYFGVTNDTLVDPLSWLSVGLCGIGGGLLGALFAKLTLLGTLRLKRLLAIQPIRRSLMVACVCGLLVAVLAIATDGATWGTGYEQARGALEGRGLAWYFAPAKLAATLLSTLAGLPGGIFAPSLAVGAGVGNIVAGWFPSAAGGAIVVLGMAGYFAGAVQAPITAFVIITEMTANHTMIIPLMISAVLGYGVSRLINPHPLYEALSAGFLKAPPPRTSKEIQGGDL
jgi:H+/Cl- antiporter ClcA